MRDAKLTCGTYERFIHILELHFGEKKNYNRLGSFRLIGETPRFPSGGFVLLAVVCKIINSLTLWPYSA